MRIDTIEQIDLENVSLQDIQWQHGTGTSVVSGTGRHKTHSYRNGVQTAIGDIEVSVWLAAAKAIIRREGLDSEVQNLKEFISEKGCLAFRKELEQRALDNCVAGLYKSPRWVLYLPYNQRYHPEVLATANLVNILPACCKKPGVVTAEQIAGAHSDTVCCPWCGIWSEFEILSDALSDDQRHGKRVELVSDNGDTLLGRG